MTTHSGDVIRGWLGWCPNERTMPRQPQVMNDNTACSGGVQGDGIPGRTGWLQQYRNRLLLLSLFFTLAAIPGVMYFGADDLTRLMMFAGIITGLGLFAYFGRWLWNSLGMLAKGLTIKTGRGEYIISFLMAGTIPYWFILLIGGMLVVISFAGIAAFPAFATGFAFVPWYVFILVLVWERRTGCILVLDKQTHSFTATRGT
jgi:hypothetical protein